MNTPIGQLNRRIAIQRPGTAQDAIGQPIDAWTDVAHLWASIRMQTGLGSIRAGADASTIPVSIRVRYRTDLDASMRVVHGATVYAVKAVMPDIAGRQFTDMVCEVAK